jgi:hypothetical protein
MGAGGGDAARTLCVCGGGGGGETGLSTLTGVIELCWTVSRTTPEATLIGVASCLTLIKPPAAPQRSKIIFLYFLVW